MNTHAIDIFNLLNTSERIEAVKLGAVQLHKLNHRLTVISKKCDEITGKTTGKGRGPALLALRDELAEKYQTQLETFKSISKLL